MTSILTNVAANSALQTLSSINTNLESAQNRVSSGYKVSEAADNVAYWSISTTMNSDNKALNAAADALGVGAAKVDTAYSAMESAIDVVNEIKAKLVTATETSTDKSQIQLEVGKLQEQLTSIAQGASFSGEHRMVAGDQTVGTVVDGFVRADGGVSVTTASYDAINRTTATTDANGKVTGFSNPGVVFVSGGRFQAGWQGTLDHYVRDYGASPATRGTLHFYDMKVEMLGPDAAMLVGRYHLERPEHANEGVNTRLFRKVDGKWLITLNHVSAYEVPSAK